MSLEFKNFSEAREQGLNLKQIKEAIKSLGEEERKKLADEINKGIIEALHKGIEVKSGDELNFLKSLTSEGNKIIWSDQKEANKIASGDIIKVIGSDIFKNDIKIGSVEGFKVNEPVKNKNQDTSTRLAQSGNDNGGKKAPSIIQRAVEGMIPSANAEPVRRNEDEAKKRLEEVDIPKSSTDKLKYSERYIIESGSVYLIGKDGKKITQNNDLSSESKELISKYEKIALLDEVLDIWKIKAHKVVNGLLWKDSRDDDEIIIEQINKIEELFPKLYEDAQKGKDIEKNMRILWSYIIKAENEESIIGESDMKEVGGIIMGDHGNKDEKLIRIYNKMRYGGISGNSETVKEKVANHLLLSNEFKDINEILKNPKIIEYISNNNKAELSKLIGKDVSKVIIDAFNKVKIKQEENRADYAKQLETINPERKKAGEKEISLDDFIKLNVNLSIENLLKNTLLEERIRKSDKRGSEKDSYKGMYANIIGLGENKGFFSDKIFTISDHNIDNAIDVSSTVALSIVSMGVGALAARGALLAATWGTRATGLAETVNAMGKTGTAIKFGSTITTEGIGFYQGTTISNNIIYGNDWNQDTGNAKEMIKSIAFMGVLRGATKVMEQAKLANNVKNNPNFSKFNNPKIGESLAMVGKMSEKVPPLMFKNTSITAILAEAGLLTTTSQSIEFVFEGNTNWTWEEYFQALILSKSIRNLGKVTFSKKGGKIEAINEPRTLRSTAKQGLEKLKGLKDFGKSIDQRLSNLPFLLNKPYTFSKWLVHKGEGHGFRSIPKEIGNSIMTPINTPRDVYRNIKSGDYSQAVKNVLFSSNDITWKGGAMKVGAYLTIPFTIEEIYKFNTIDGYEWGADTLGDSIGAVSQDYLSNMYLGVINSLIIEYLNDDTSFEQ